jgi:hypothetical protein
MLFNIPFQADWNKIGDYRQCQTDLNTVHENKSQIEKDYQPGDKVLLRKDGILRKSESKFHKEPWTISTVHTNGTIRINHGTKSEQLNIRRVAPYFSHLHHVSLSMLTLTSSACTNVPKCHLGYTIFYL